MSLLDSIDASKVLASALSKGGDFAEIYIEDSTNTSVICEDDKIEKVVSGRDRGCGIRVVSGLKTFYSYTNDISNSGLLGLSEVVAGAVRTGETLSDFGEFKKEYAKGFEILKPTGDLSLSEKVKLVKLGNKLCRGYDKRVKQAKVVYGDAFKRVAIVNSRGTWVEEDRNSILYLCQVVTEENGIIQTGYEPVGGAMGLEIFDLNPIEKIAETAAKRGIMMLGARKAPGGTMSVILSSDAGGTMIHEAVGHGLEADLANEGLSVYAGRVGDKVASELITVIDDGTMPNKRGSCAYDDEGTPMKKNVLVEDGILKTYMYDILSDMKDEKGTATGNGRRESYRHRPIVRMTNTIIAPGKSDPEEVLKSVDNGLLVKKMGGGQVNTVNGEFVFEVTEGYMIENGEVGDPVRGATLTGTGPEVLNSIDMVGSDLGFSIGTCGKDGQGVPVTDAIPTIRIPEIVVGGGVGG